MTARPHLHIIRTSVFAITFVAVLSISASTLFAQTLDTTQTQTNQVTLTTIPPRYGENGELTIKPGEKTQIQVRVRNSSNQTLPIRSVAQDFILDEDGQTPVAITDTVSNRWSLSQWITLVPATQTLQPGETGVVNVLIEVPAEGLPGGHYAMITHQPDTSGGVGETVGSAISQKVGTLIYASVDGPINEQAFIRNFDFNNGKFAEFGPINYGFIIENESDIHIRPQMSITVRDILGRTVATLEPETKNIFPLANRSFEGSWEQVWGNGYYSAELVASYGKQGNVIIAKDTFWLLPIKLVIAVIILILTLIAIAVSVRRHLIHRQDDRNKKIAVLENRLKEIENEKLKKFED